VIILIVHVTPLDAIDADPKVAGGTSIELLVIIIYLVTRH